MVDRFTSNAIQQDEQHHNVGTVPKSNREIVERGKIDTPSRKIHDHSFSSFGTGTSIKN
jgi:hypothetical protein